MHIVHQCMKFYKTLNSDKVVFKFKNKFIINIICCKSVKGNILYSIIFEEKSNVRFCVTGLPMYVEPSAVRAC
jgi:hypothetical protein